MGWTYNANEGAETNGPTLTAVGSTFTVLSFLIVVLRMYVRGFLVRAIGAGELRGCWTLREDMTLTAGR
jgi:hypothetical protein